MTLVVRGSGRSCPANKDIQEVFFISPFSHGCGHPPARNGLGAARTLRAGRARKTRNSTKHGRGGSAHRIRTIRPSPMAFPSGTIPSESSTSDALLKKNRTIQTFAHGVSVGDRKRQVCGRLFPLITLPAMRLHVLEIFADHLNFAGENAD